ncbi:MAG: DNA-directed RNA polymerase subunit omega [Nitrospirae bacterium]|nr:MAG: DNA-directed RNA polymerase subunit omega [Nitrospirota bacterium]
MLSLLPDDQLDHFDSRYRLVLVAAQRAKQLMQGAKPPESSKYTKMTSIALEEALHGKVPYLKGQEARQALKEARRRAEHEFDRVMLAEADEDAKEIQQQLSVYIDDSPKEESAEGSEESEE